MSTALSTACWCGRLRWQTIFPSSARYETSSTATEYVLSLIKELFANCSDERILSLPDKKEVGAKAPT